MGIFNSKTENMINELKQQIEELKIHDRTHELTDLKHQLDELKSIDKNNDSIISKNELYEWIIEQRNQKQLEIDTKYNEMQKEIETLKSINRNLEQKLANASINETNEQNQNTRNVEKIEISKKQIDIFVERLLNNKDINIKYLPDYVERQLYRNMFTILINLIQNLTDTTEIKFMGHKILLSVAPNEEPTNE